jgi:hypothetical protein
MNGNRADGYAVFTPLGFYRAGNGFMVEEDLRAPIRLLQVRTNVESNHSFVNLFDGG